MYSVITVIRSLACRLAILILSFLIIAPSSRASDDPTLLQQRAVQRIERIRDHYRETAGTKGMEAEIQLAEGELQASYKSFLTTGNLAPASLSLIQLGYIRRLQNAYQPAKTFYEKAYELAKQARHDGYQGRALLGKAVTEMSRQHDSRDYQAATRDSDEALRLLSKGGDKKYLFEALLTKSEIQDARGDFKAAVDTSSLAISVAIETNDQHSLIRAYFSRGGFYSHQARSCDYRRATEFCFQAVALAKSDFEQARSIAKKLGFNLWVKVLTENLNGAEEIKSWLRKFEEDASVLNNNSAASVKNNSPKWFHPQKASDVWARQDYLLPGSNEKWAAEAEKLLSLHEEENKRLGSSADDYNLNYVRGQILVAKGQNEAALEYFLKAVKQIEAEYEHLSHSSPRGDFLEGKMHYFYEPINHLLDRRQLPEAFDLMERSKSYAMVDLLRGRELKLARPMDQKLYAEYIKLNADISLLQQKLFRLQSGEAGRDQYVQDIAATRKEVEKLEGDRQTILKRMSSEESKLQEFVKPQPVTLRALQQSMKRDQYNVLYYLVVNPNIIIWHLSGDRANWLYVTLPKEEIINKVTRLRNSLVDRKNDPGVKFDQQTARELFLFLIQPMLNEIKANHLVIIPHEDLNYVPFQVFLDPANNQYLGERFQISYAPSATVLSKLNKAENIRSGNMLAVADSDIPDSKDEVQVLRSLYRGRGKFVIGPAVKEAEVKSLVGGYDLVHLSVHGKFSPQEPLLSHLVFQQGGSDDGKLTAAEMFGLPLTKAQLVVLGACDTGQARATRANEIIGMQRALLYAGANNLVLSSWAVDAASTALWMETFYREAQSKPLSEAARLALTAVKNNPQYSHPYYWSPFLLIGK